MNAQLMINAREEYLALPPEEQTKYLTQLADAYGQDFVDSFTSFIETGNLPKFEAAVTTTPELPAGKLEEIPGRANGYERTMDEVAASLNAEHTPVYEAVVAMGQQFGNATPVKQAEMMDKITQAKGQEFSEAVHFAFTHSDFCEMVARECQSFYDTLAKNFSESSDPMGSLAKIGNFSENMSKGVLSYITKGKPGNFSILETVALLTNVARQDFAENGELAGAIEELGEGLVSPEGADKVAENINANATGALSGTPEAIEQVAVKSAGEGTEDMSCCKKGCEKGSFSEGETQETVIREKEQNNEVIDAIVEKYKGLQSDEARQLMLTQLQQLIPVELVNYIVSRVEGEDFSEETPAPAELPVATPKVGGGEEELKAATEKAPVTEEIPTTQNEGDLDKYEKLSKELLGQYEMDPVASVVAAEAPVAVSTLPEGAPVSATEGGTTMAEDYERKDIIDTYKGLGLV